MKVGGVENAREPNVIMRWAASYIEYFQKNALQSTKERSMILMAQKTGGKPSLAKNLSKEITKVNLKDKKVCDWEGCTNAPGPAHFIHGKAYCPKHYDPALEKHFFEELEKWDRNGEPRQKFRNLFARYIELLHEKNEVLQGLPYDDAPDRLTKGRDLTKGMLERLSVKEINEILDEVIPYKRRRDTVNHCIKTYGKIPRAIRPEKKGA